MPDQKSRDRIQSIERGVQVLRAFDGQEASLSIAAIAARVALARPVVRRVLLTFEHLGYVAVTNGTWRLTPRVLEVGAGYFAASSLPQISYSYLPDVVERTGETCSVGVLDALEVIHVARMENRRPMPDSVRIGNRLPAHATAIGKVLLGDLPQAELEHRLRGVVFEAQTPQTITEPEALLERISVVRKRGYDVSIEELHPGWVAAAVPIVVDGRAVGGLTSSSTTVRENEQSLVDIVRPVLLEAAAAIGSAYRNANPQLFRSA